MHAKLRPCRTSSWKSQYPQTGVSSLPSPVFFQLRVNVKPSSRSNPDMGTPSESYAVTAMTLQKYKF